MKLLSFALLSFLSIFCTDIAFSQTDFTYFSPLSKDIYANKIKEIKERKPSKVYTDKDEQKYFESIVNLRNETLRNDLEKNQIVIDTLLLGRCNVILAKMKANNNAYNFENIQFYIYRTAVPNAASLGDGSFYVNLGLFLVIDNDDELALILGHELAHYFLKHFEKRIDNNIKLLSSDDFKEEMKSIKKASDGKYTRFRKLLKEISTQGGTHSRFKESEADSLGLIFCANAGYNKATAAKVLLKLEHSDDFFTKEKLYDLKSAFSNKIPDIYFAPPKKKYNGLSTVEVTMNADAEFDSIKTHPDCVLRYKAITKSEVLPALDCCLKISKAQTDIKKRVLVEIARDLYESENFTFLIHICEYAIISGFDDAFFSDYKSLALSGIARAEREIRRFSVTNAAAKPGSTLKEVQDLMFKLDRADVLDLSNVELLLKETEKEDHAFAFLKYRIELTPQNEESLTNAFKSKYPKSKYNYILNPLTK